MLGIYLLAEKDTNVQKIEFLKGLNEITDNLITLQNSTATNSTFFEECTWMARTHVALFENHRKKMKI